MQTYGKNLTACVLISGLAIAGLGTKAYANENPQEEYAAPVHSDPLETINRSIWDFNYQVLDKHLLRPAAVFYRDHIPEPAQDGIYNFVSNLDEPYSVVNNLLQGKFGYAANATGRFLVNSTVGVLGIFDVANELGMERKQDEFGEVLATWGVGEGAYLMMPAMGPTTVRNEAGDLVDNLYFPLEALHFWQSVSLKVLKGIHLRAKYMEQETLLENSLDPYIFIQEAYYQQREFDIYDGVVPKVADSDEFDDDYVDDYVDDDENI